MWKFQDFSIHQILREINDFFRRISPTEANVYRSLEVVLNYVLQICLEHMVFHPTDVVGILFLTLAGITIYLEDAVMKKQLYWWL